MSLPLETTLFPDDCEVVEIPPHSQWVYLIQKNGSSSLRTHAQWKDYYCYRNEQIAKLDFVDVYIRSPQARYISGVNTFLQHLARDHKHLDQTTALWFVKQYKFLNRHYLPQFYWIQNLARFTKPNAKLRIHSLGTLDVIIPKKNRANIIPPTRDFIDKLVSNDTDIKFWWYLDQILLDLSGQSLTWSELQEHYRVKFPSVAVHVLPKT